MRDYHHQILKAGSQFPEDFHHLSFAKGFRRILRDNSSWDFVYFTTNPLNKSTTSLVTESKREVRRPGNSQRSSLMAPS
jgi:hypothetical protein